jgi:hypothetical protein
MHDAATVADLHESAGARPTGLLAVDGTRMPPDGDSALPGRASPAFGNQIHGHEPAGLTDRRSRVDSDEGDEKR